MLVPILVRRPAGTQSMAGDGCAGAGGFSRTSRTKASARPRADTKPRAPRRGSTYA